MNSVVITGMSLACGPLVSAEELVDLIFSRSKSIFEKIERYPVFGGVAYASQYPRVSIKDLPDPKLRKTVNEKDLMALIVMIRALEDANFHNEQMDSERVGLFVGTAHSIFGDLAPYLPLIQGSIQSEAGVFCSETFGKNLTSQINPMVVMRSLLNNALSSGSRSFDARGPNGNYMDLEVSGLQAVIAGMQAIQDGRADIAVTGGVSTTVEPFSIDDGLANGIYANTENGLAGSGPICQPYSKSSLGSVPSESAGFLVLESESHARMRGAKILGRLKAAKSQVDACWNQAETSSSGIEGVSASLLSKSSDQNLRLAGIISGANGVVQHDQKELNGLFAAFRNSGLELPLSSIKGATGETNEASGPINLIAALESLRRKELPPTRYFQGDADHGRQLSISSEPQLMNGDAMMVICRNQLGLCSGVVATL